MPPLSSPPMPPKLSCTEHSYGIVPLQKIDDIWHMLLIQHGRVKYWGYPKGHAEPGETPVAAAKRELREETNLTVVRFLADSPFEEHYVFTSGRMKVFKTVSFFAAEVAGDLKLQEDEVSGCRWLPLDSAEEHLTYETDKAIWRRVKDSMQGDP